MVAISTRASVGSGRCTGALERHRSVTEIVSVSLTRQLLAAPRAVCKSRLVANSHFYHLDPLSRLAVPSAPELESGHGHVVSQVLAVYGGLCASQRGNSGQTH